MSELWRELRWAARFSLRRHPAFAASCILSLALGTGCTTALFGFLRAVVIEPLPFEDPQSLVVLRTSNVKKGRSDEGASGPDFLDWQAQCRSFQQMAVAKWRFLELIRGESYQRVEGYRVTRDFLSVLRVTPYLGQGITAEQEMSQDLSLLLSHDIWQQQWEGDPSIVGRTITIGSWDTHPDPGRQAYRVAGILPANLRFLPTSTWFRHLDMGVDRKVGFLTPFDVRRHIDRSWHDLTVVARLNDGVSIEQAQAEMDIIASNLAQQYPDTNEGWQVRVVPVNDFVLGGIRHAAYGVSLAVGCVWLIACLHVTMLNLIRGTARQTEFGIRVAMGARPVDIFRQLLLETLLLGVAGAVVGMLLAWLTVQAVLLIAPAEIPRIDEVRFDGGLALFAVFAALASSLVASLVPAWRAGTPRLSSLLQRASGTSGARDRLGSTLTVAELAGTFALMVVAGFALLRLVQTLSMDAGFAWRNRLTATLSLPAAEHEWDENTRFHQRVVAAVRQLPGVRSAAVATGMPLTGVGFDARVIVEGRLQTVADKRTPARIRVISEEYFRTMGIPLLAGRYFEPRDFEDIMYYTRVSLINQTMARRFWGSANPLGRRFKLFDAMPWIEVIGVVGDAHYEGPGRDVICDFYYPERLFPQSITTLVVHTVSDPLQFANAVRRVIRAEDPDAHINDLKTMAQLRRESTSQQRLAALLLSALAVVGLLLSSTAIYGITAYGLARRAQEIGIRLAIGAQPRHILSLLLWRNIRLAVLGQAIGLGIAALVLQWFAGSLWRGDPKNALLLIAYTLTVFGLTIACTALAARKAARRHPAEALRN